MSVWLHNSTNSHIISEKQWLLWRERKNDMKLNIYLKNKHKHYTRLNIPDVIHLNQLILANSDSIQLFSNTRCERCLCGSVGCRTKPPNVSKNIQLTLYAYYYFVFYLCSCFKIIFHWWLRAQRKSLNDGISIRNTNPIKRLPQSKWH